jgi:TRAP-type uncharacterized transport system substrate-binding protein
MAAQFNLMKVLWKWVAPIVGLTALALALYFYFHSPAQRSYRLRLTAGNELGTRHQLAMHFQSETAQQNVTFELLPSAGSEQALDWVNTRKVDAALVQGGLTSDGRSNVRQVATLHVEPMHLLVKKELFRDTVSSLVALRGKTVDLGEVGSGTHSLASAILDFVGLQPHERDPGGYVPLTVDRQHLLAEKDTARLPDAVFLVSSLPSSSAAYLVTKHGYRLVPLPFAEAFALGSLVQGTEDEQRRAGTEHVIKGRIQAVTIPAFAYGVDPPVPEQPLPTLGTRLLLVAHKDVPPRAAYQLVEATYAAEFGRIVRPPLDAKLMDLPPEFPWHDGAQLYQQRNAPLLSGELMDSAHKGFAIFAAAASGLFVLWQWSKLYGQRARNRGLNQYIAQVTRIEERVMQVERNGPPDATELLGLRDQLGRLKTQALDDFARDELAGKEFLAGFLVQVNDVRDHLMRLLDKRDVGEVAKIDAAEVARHLQA